MRSELEQAMWFTLRAASVPPWVEEHRFHPTRRWRFDFSWPERLIAIEVEGGTWVGGRHVTGTGFRRDAEKYNAAALLGWRVFRLTGGMIEDGDALELVERIFQER